MSTYTDEQRNQISRKTLKNQIIIAVAVVFTTAFPIQQALAGEPLRRTFPEQRRHTATPGFRTTERTESDRADVATMNWSEAKLKLSAPEEISRAVKSRIKYSRDMIKEDEWRSGQDTWEKKEGDCEDYAVAVKELCEENGIKAEIIVLRSITDREAHAVTVGERNGQIWVSNNGSYREFSTMDEAQQAIARDQGWTSNKVIVENESVAKSNTSNQAPANAAGSR